MGGAEHVPQKLLLERFGHDGAIVAEKVYPTFFLAMIWGRQDVRKFEQILEKAGVPVKRLGGGLALVRGQDLFAICADQAEACSTDGPIDGTR